MLMSRSPEYLVYQAVQSVVPAPCLKATLVFSLHEHLSYYSESAFMAAYVLASGLEQ